MRIKLADWWYYAHRVGPLCHCDGVILWCLLDNIAHAWLRVPLDQDLRDDDDYPDVPDHWGYWICRRHDRAVLRAYLRKEHGQRARNLRRLGWGR